MVSIAHVQYIKFYVDSEAFESKLQFFKPPLSGNSQKKSEHKEHQTKYGKMTRKPRSHVRILIYWTWAIVKNEGAVNNSKGVKSSKSPDQRSYRSLFFLHSGFRHSSSRFRHSPCARVLNLRDSKENKTLLAVYKYSIVRTTKTYGVNIPRSWKSTTAHKTSYTFSESSCSEMTCT